MATAHRATSGVIFAVVFLLGVFVNELWFLVPIIACFGTAVGTVEFFHMARRRYDKANRTFAVVMAVALVIVGYYQGLDSRSPLFFIITAALLGSFVLTLVRRGITRFLAQSSITFLGSFYVGLPLAMVMAILNAPFLQENAPRHSGRFLIVFLIIVTWSADIGAYFVGRKFGRRKLAPSLSPGKSIEGFYGGIGFTILMAVLLKLRWPQVGQIFLWSEVLVLGLLFSTIGVMGDLVESAIKREAGVKDSGPDWTGHGGMLDIIDSLLFTAPIFYLHMTYIHPMLH